MHFPTLVQGTLAGQSFASISRERARRLRLTKDRASHFQVDPDRDPEVLYTADARVPWWQGAVAQQPGYVHEKSGPESNG